MLTATPSKKTLTDDMRSAIDTSNAHRDTIVPEDLSLALQNLGSRVRKSVTEGYNTQCLAPFTVPVTPYSSPSKPPITQTTPTPIFRTAHDAFTSVFTPGNPRPPLTPSPRKRSRAEVEANDAEARRSRDEDVDMDEDGADSDAEDDQVMVILGPDANSNVFSLPRKIKPLRRGIAPVRTSAPQVDPFLVAAQAAGPTLFVQDGAEMDLSEGAVA